MLKNHFSKNLPYSGTTVSVEETQFEIQSMLKQFGVKAVRWTSSPEAMDGVALPTLEFLVRTEIRGVEKDIGIRVIPVILKKSVGSGSNRRFTDAPEQSMRLMYWWLKSKLEAVRYGLESVEEVLMSRIIVQLSNGETTTIGETVLDELALPSPSTKNLLPSFKIVSEEGAISV